MNKRILIGVDTAFSVHTQHALCTAAELFEQSDFVLLTVIPLPYDPTPLLMRSYGVEQVRPKEATRQQREQAEGVLARAAALIQQSDQALTMTYIERMWRFGVPAEEVVKVAREQHVESIILGKQGDSFLHGIRRIVSGSITREVLRSAPCPVMLIPPVHSVPLSSLVTWYETAITRYLQEQQNTLQTFTPEEILRRFVPPTSLAQRGDLAAATCALERLKRLGKLVCYQNQQYVND